MDDLDKLPVYERLCAIIGAMDDNELDLATVLTETREERDRARTEESDVRHLMETIYAEPLLEWVRVSGLVGKKDGIDHAEAMEALITAARGKKRNHEDEQFEKFRSWKELDEARTAIKCTEAVLENIAEFGHPIGFECEVPELAERVAMDFGEICEERDKLKTEIERLKDQLHLIDAVAAHCNKALEVSGDLAHAECCGREPRQHPLQAENTELRKKLKRFAAWILRTGIGRDYACAHCYPNSKILVDGFICTYHQAVEYCDHEFADTEHCVKCGWTPDEEG